MTGAAFVLAINIAIATTMAIAFFAVGHFDIRNRAANWFGLAFLLANIGFAGEYVLHAGLSDSGARMAIALGLLASFLLVAHALAIRYAVEVPAAGLAAILAASTLLYYLILDLPRSDLTRQILYQVPYTLVSLLGASILWRSGQRRVIDIALLVVLVASALTFASKPLIAVFTGGVGAVSQDYAVTLYALISQSSGAITALLLAMLCLALVISDSALWLVRRTERDGETELLNQHGLEQHGARLMSAMARSDTVTIMLFSVDTTPEDWTGFELNSRLAEGLAGVFGPQALIARLSSQTFAALLPSVNLLAARRQAEILRARAGAGALPGLSPAHLSIGIAEHETDDGLAEMMARAQWALDEARRSGGNCVRLSARAAFSVTRNQAV